MPRLYKGHKFILCIIEAKGRMGGTKCADIKSNLERNNTRKAYQIVKDLTMQRQAKVSAIQDKKWQMSDRKERNPDKVDGILLRTLQPQDGWRPHSIAL